MIEAHRMGRSIRGASLSLVAVAALSGIDAAAQTSLPDAMPPASPDTADSSKLRRVDGMVLLDYQVIPVPQGPTIDLMGVHVLNKVSDWASLGIGVYAPLIQGEYGGFMAFDIAAHAQHQVWGNFFADGGVSIGGGGGGKSAQQSIMLSGTGGFATASVGLGYDFGNFAVGANVTKIKFKSSTIDSTHLNVFVQVPFSYVVGPYSASGSKASGADARSVLEDPSESTLTLGVEDVVQIDPKASYQGKFQLADFQFTRYLTQSAYWYASLGLGYQGLPLYNQMIGGLGVRFSVGPKLNLHAQLGVGSGGYAPEKIDTGSGLLVYPKVSAEYDISRNYSISLTGGYLFAPKGSSKNYTLGASLNYHIQPRGESAGAGGFSNDIRFKGYRFSLFQQTEFNVSYRGIGRSPTDMFSLQLDSLVNRYLYIPIQASIAYTAYLGYPGYGEILAGVGVQSDDTPDQRLQFFGQLLAGANVHGAIVKAAIGANYGLSDALALRASVGRTQGPSSGGRNFKANDVELGLTYRFSIPGW